jgi:hypothetical protein
MSTSDVRVVVEYGVQAPMSRTVVLVTDKFQEAEHMLDLVGDGCIVRRTVSYGAWHAVGSAGQSMPVAG